MFYFSKTPWVLKKLYPECVWAIRTNEKILYLTFDDGPHLKATPFVLEQLEKYNAKATLFCITIVKNLLTNYYMHYQKCLSIFQKKDLSLEQLRMTQY